MSDYDASSIASLKYPENVRTRPDMYIGDRGVDGYHHCAYEIIDNSVDEHMAGHASKIIIRLLDESTLEVEDNGRGIPVEMHPTEKVSALEVVLTKLHAGGKFNRDSYQVSGGLHGVGLSVVNALSSYLECFVYRKGKIYHIRFEGGTKVQELKTIGKTDKIGTLVRFCPDPEIFQTNHFSASALTARLREIAFLNPGLEIVFENHLEKDPENEDLFLSHVFKYDQGILQFLTDELNKDQDMLFENPVNIETESNGIKIHAVFQYRNSGDDPEIYSYVNSIHTKNHGIHVDGFWISYEKVMQKFAMRLNLDKKGDKVSKKTLSFGFTCVINTRIPNAEFKGQTKDKLTEPIEARRIIRNAVETALSLYFEKNIKLAETIVRKSILELKALQEADKARDNVRSNLGRGKRASMADIAGKLADCSSRKKELRELFIVEGDSAGGSAKQGRDREIQAILPLRGKILNVERKLDKKNFQSIMANKEIRTMIAVLGAGYYNTFELSKLKYNKIVIMTDADVDGSHIRILLLTFFYRFMRPMLEEGHVYIAQPPLYMIKAGKTFDYAYSDNERDKIVKEKYKNRKYSIQRYKGLGEMNADQLWDTTMNPLSRKMLRVNITDFEESNSLIKTLMSDEQKSFDRKDFILSNVSFVTNIDDIG